MVANSARNSGRVFACERSHSDSDAHGGGNADGGRSADDHVLDRARDLAVIGIGVVDHFAGEPPLVEHDDALGRPADGFDCAHGYFFHGLSGRTFLEF